MNLSVRELARHVATLTRKVEALSRPQLAHSSIEDGAIEEYDGDGNLVSRIGVQPDGSHGVVVVDGPDPLRTSTPIVSATALAIRAAWDGNLIDPATGVVDAELQVYDDFDFVEVHVGTVVNFVPDRESRVGTIQSRLGGETVVPSTAGERFVKFVTRAKSGKTSIPSVGAAVTVPTLVDTEQFEDLREDLEAASLWILESGTDLTARLIAAEGDIDSAETNLDAAQTALSTAFPTGAFNVEDAVSGAMTDAQIAAAADAKVKADAAQEAAELAAQAYADGAISAAGVTLLQQAATAAQAKVDELEGDTTTAIANAKALSEQYAAGLFDSAMLAVNGKNVITYTTIARGATIPAAPSATGRVNGDIHRVRYSDNGEIAREYTRISGAWQQVRYGDAILTSVDVGKLVAGTGVIDNAVINKMSTQLASIIKADIGNLTVTGTSVLATAVVDELWAKVVRSRKITTDMLLVGRGQNLIPNSELSSTDGWPGWGRNLNNGPNNTPSIWLEGRVYRQSEVFPVEGGVWYRFRVLARAQYAGSRMYVQFLNNGVAVDGKSEGSGVLVTNPYAVSNVVLPTSDWGVFEGTFLMPSDATQARIQVYGNHANGTSTNGYQWYTAWGLHSKADGSLIVDGAIQGRHVAAESVAAEIGQFVEVEADQITGGQIDALVGISSAGKIVAGNPTGARAQMDSVGFRYYNAANQPIFDASGGSVELKGKIVAGSDSNGVTVQPDATKLGNASIEFKSSALVKNPYLAVDTVNGTPALNLVGPGRYTADVPAVISMSSAGYITQQAETMEFTFQDFLVMNSENGNMTFETSASRETSGNIRMRGRQIRMEGPPSVGDSTLKLVVDGEIEHTGDVPWQTYDPILTSTGTNPSGLASANRVGRYRKIGRTVHLNIYIYIPSGFNRGSGAYQIRLPFPATSAAIVQLLTANVVASGIGDVSGVAKIEALEDANRIFRIQLVNQTRTGTPAHSSLSEAFPSSTGLGGGSRIVISGSYEAAS